MVFVGDQNKYVIRLLEVDIEYKAWYGMKYKCTDLIVSWNY
jgi:hypothetical protein